MKREITIDGKTYEVEVTECPVGEPFSVKVNSKPREVTLEHEPENSKTFTIRVDRKSYQIELSNFEKNSPLAIKVNNIPFKVEIKLPPVAPKIGVAEPSLVSELMAKPTKALGEGVVAAPMAGKIISVRVKKGDAVKAGSVVCVLEAMKMENEIASPKSGVVEEVKVEEGKAVNEGDILVLIK